MLYYIIKVIVTALIIVGVSEIGKRSSFWGAALAALPLVSLLAFVWLYVETGDELRIASMSQNIFWLVLPSLPFFLLLPTLLHHGWGFWPSLLTGCVVTAGIYAAMVILLGKWGVNF